MIDHHHVLDFHKEAIAVIVENSHKELLLIHAYRYVIDTIDWELPAGNLEKGESPVDGARRETLEETGYEISEPEVIYSYYPMPGIANQIFHVVRSKASRLSDGFDKNEVKGLEWASTDQVLEMIKSRQIKDGFSLSALLLHMRG